MIRKAYVTEKREGLVGGKGGVAIDHWMEEGEKCPNLTVCATITLDPGSTVGDHFHHGEAEVYVVLSGKGMYNDNGTKAEVRGGDVLVCYDGECHGLENTSDAPFVFQAVVITG